MSKRNFIVNHNDSSYYIGAGIGWGGLPGAAYSKDKSKAKRMTEEEADRFIVYWGGKKEKI